MQNIALCYFNMWLVLLMQDYVQTVKGCLTGERTQPDTYVASRMLQLVFEMYSLRVAYMKRFCQSNADSSRPQRPAQSPPNSDHNVAYLLVSDKRTARQLEGPLVAIDADQALLAVPVFVTVSVHTLVLQRQSALVQATLCPSQDQIADLMCLRRVHYLKQHELMSRRAALTAQMQGQDMYDYQSSDRVADIAAELQLNAKAEHDLFVRNAWTFYFGVNLRARACGSTPACLCLLAQCKWQKCQLSLLLIVGIGHINAVCVCCCK